MGNLQNETDGFFGGGEGKKAEFAGPGNSQWGRTILTFYIFTKKVFFPVR